MHTRQLVLSAKQVLIRPYLKISAFAILVSGQIRLVAKHVNKTAINAQTILTANHANQASIYKKVTTHA
jgi:hypothetical protein